MGVWWFVAIVCTIPLHVCTRRVWVRSRYPRPFLCPREQAGSKTRSPSLGPGEKGGARDSDGAGGVCVCRWVSPSLNSPTAENPPNTQLPRNPPPERAAPAPHPPRALATASPVHTFPVEGYHTQPRVVQEEQESAPEHVQGVLPSFTPTPTMPANSAAAMTPRTTTEMRQPVLCVKNTCNGVSMGWGERGSGVRRGLSAGPRPSP